MCCYIICAYVHVYVFHLLFSRFSFPSHSLYSLPYTLILYFSTGKLDPDYVPDLRLTSPVFKIGPYPSWSDPKKISGTVY